MAKLKTFKILWKYIKEEKIKLILYITLVALSYLPALITTILWGIAIEALTNSDWNLFLYTIISYEAMQILFYGILEIPRGYLYKCLEIKFMKEVSKDLYHKIQNLPAIAFEEIGIGEFINRLYTDPDRILELLSKLIRLICKSTIIIMVLIYCFSISPILGLEIIILAFIMGIISWKFFPHIKKSNEKIKKQSDKYVKEATENITGIREIKSLGIKRNIENKLHIILNNMFKDSENVAKYERWYYSLNSIAYFAIQLIIFITAGKYYVDGLISLSMFMVIEAYIWRVDDVVESLSDFGVNLNKVTVSLNRIDEILNNKLYEDESYGNIELKDPIGKIEFKNVYFRYRETEENTLKGLELTLEPYKKLAIVGRSGNGKSTIFNLLLRYFDSTKGEILIDGINIKDLTEKSLRNTISIIRQDPFLFNLSIIDNFKLVKENVTLEEIRKVCKQAYIDDYIMSLNDGYETIIGEGGVNLSGGQKQRIAIARTLLLNTKIILFDEATSALDNESQQYIKKTIDNLVKDHTIIIVAHRLSTIVDADIIHIIDDGKLIGKGTHEYLLKNDKIYHNLYINEDISQE